MKAMYKKCGTVTTAGNSFSQLSVLQSAQSERKPDPTHETAPFFLYNIVKTATHSFFLKKEHGS